MLYEVIRLIICSLIAVGIVFLCKRKLKKMKPIYYLVALLGVSFLAEIFKCVPVENVFVEFPSAEACFEYTDMATPYLVIDGEESSLVVGKDSQGFVCRVIGNEGGWKIDVDGKKRTLVKDIPGELVVSVYRYDYTNDYYLEVNYLSSNKTKKELTDSNGSVFYALTQDSYATGDKIYTYFAYVSSMDENYKLYIDDEEFTIRT